MGALGRPARSLPPWCQTNLFSQRCRPVSQAQPAERRESWTVTATIADALAGRSRAAILPVLADMRSIAASGIFGRTAVSDGLGSLRPSERMERKCSLRNCSEMEWSGCKLMSPASGAAELCRCLARPRKCRLSDAGPFAFPQRGAKRRGFPA